MMKSTLHDRDTKGQTPRVVTRACHFSCRSRVYGEEKMCPTSCSRIVPWISLRARCSRIGSCIKTFVYPSQFTYIHPIYPGPAKNTTYLGHPVTQSLHPNPPNSLRTPSSVSIFFTCVPSNFSPPALLIFNSSIARSFFSSARIFLSCGLPGDVTVGSGDTGTGAGVGVPFVRVL